MVSGSVPKRVVDVLEAVEIEHVDGQPAPRLPDLSQRHAHWLQQRRPVCQSSQGIVRGGIGNLGFSLLSRSDIDPDRHIRNGLAVDAELPG